jgi:protease-4
MSDADREQWQKIIDDWYAVAKHDICTERHIATEQFDTIMVNRSILSATEAKAEGLVDAVGRWTSVEAIVQQQTGSRRFKPARTLEAYHRPYDAQWGEPPAIAVIYALGACAMDEGITARKLVRDVQSAVNDHRIKAIVLRVDSPGGDAMASDYIADALREARGKKPVIVSQGYVAGSGGYWLSMYADTIVAAPGTITGSIGVIGGWAYNKGLKESLGFSTDLVQAGAHADLGTGFRLPFIGIGLPDRNLNDQEHRMMEHTIKTMYREFVGKVSAGRKKSYAEIDSIAQGRVWSGIDGQKNGLVDLLGGMETAIRVAKERAGISPDQEVTIVELPKKGLLNIDAFVPRLFGVQTSLASDPLIDLLKFRLTHNGEVLPMLPLDDVDPAMLDR